MKKNNKGFSLVELIVVVLIMGILAVALTPQVMKWVDKSRIAADKDTLQAVKSAAALAFTSKDVYNKGTVIINLGTTSGIDSASTNTGFATVIQNYAGGPVSDFTFKKTYTTACKLSYTTDGILTETIDNDLKDEITD